MSNQILSTAKFAAEMGLRAYAVELVRSALKTKKAQERNIAALPKPAQKGSFFVKLSAEGIEIAPNWPKSQGVHKLVQGELWEAAAAAKLVASPGIEVDVENLAVRFTNPDARVLEWKLLDPRTDKVRRVYLDKMGLKRSQIVESKSLAQRISFVVRFASGEAYGAFVTANSKAAHYLDSLLATDSKARYWAGAVARRSYRKAVREHNGDREAAAAILKAYRVVRKDGSEKIVRLREEDAEAMAEFVAAIEPATA